MKLGLPSAIRKLVYATAHRWGYQLVPTNGYRIVPLDTTLPTSLDRFFSMLKRQGFSPKHVIDVGAHKGGWTRCALQYFPHARYTLIEPQAELKQHAQDLLNGRYQIEWLTAGAGDKPGTLNFTVNPRADSSSFRHTRQEAESAGFTQVPVEVLTLNDVVKSRNASPPDLVKIDAEGFDLKVLAGASDLLGTTDVFLLEGSICCPNLENTAAAVIGTMTQAGYRLIDVTDLNRNPKNEVLWLCEFAFLRNGSSLWQGISTYE
jgi:FkbM family methyltransferase